MKPTAPKRQPGFIQAVWGRRRKILQHRNVKASIALGLIYAVSSCLPGPLAPRERVAIEGLVGGTFALAGFGFSVALAAVAMVIALPSSRMLRNMVLEKESPEAPSAFADIVFLFTWTGVVQGVAAATGMIALISAGKSVLLTIDDPPGLIFGTAVVVTSAYALMQLITAMVTIHQIALLQARYFETDSGRAPSDVKPTPESGQVEDVGTQGS